MQMYDTDDDLLYALSVGPDTLTRLLEGCSQEQARNARGGDENWSIVEVVMHLRDAEERALERALKIRDEDNPFLEAYDQDEWAKERNYASADLSRALSEFVEFRKAHVDAIKGLAAGGWDRTGEHEEQGQITIRGQVIHLILHDATHSAQIARQLSG
jgi:hypothetical protein